MNKNRYICIILIFLLCLISISAASAADDTVNADDNQEISISDSINDDAYNFDSIEKTNDKDYGSSLILENNAKPNLKEGETDPGTLADLDDLINNQYSTNSTITLGRDYIGGSQVTINRPLTIDGQGYTLNGNDETRIFHIMSDNVILKNINFIKGNAWDGGAILWEGNNGEINKCNFTDNVATHKGGAIHWGNPDEEQGQDNTGPGSNANVKESNFNHNSAQLGGAIYWYAENGAVTDNSSFNENIAEYNGGAIFWKNGGHVSNSTFTSNTAKNNGGAIYGNAYSDKNSMVLVDNCYFSSNEAYSLTDDDIEKGGGAIFAHCNITHSSFIGNKHHKDSETELMRGGGAVHLVNGGTVTSCLFENNFCEAHGGAIWYSTFSDISNCIFLGNTSPFENDDHINVFGETGTPSMNTPSGGHHNWFGNTEGNYNSSILNENTSYSNWLFLNATADPDVIPCYNTSDVSFKLYLYDNETKETYEYDNSLLPDFYLALSSENGTIDKESAKFNETIKFNGTQRGTGSVTAVATTSVEQTIILTIIKEDPKLKAYVDPVEIDYGENATIKLEFNPLATGTVNITFTGNKRNYTFNEIALNNTILIPGLLPDEYDVNVSYSGEDNFLPANASAEDKLIVNKISPNMEVEGHNIYVNDTEGRMFTISFAEDATGKINLTGDIEKQLDLSEGEIKDGKLIIEIDNNGLAIGKYNVTFKYLGDDIYCNATSTGISEIMIIETEIIPDNETIDLLVGEKSLVNYTKNPSDMIGEISFSSNDTNVVKVDSSTGEIEAIGEGIAIITISFSGSENYTASNATVNIKVAKEKSQLTAENMTAVYNTESYLEVTLKDSKNNPISGAELTVDLNGENKYTTDSNGTIKIPTKDLAANTYTAEITYAGNDKYIGTNTTAKVTIEKDNAKLNASDLTVTYKEDKYLEVSLKDSKNNPISNVELTVDLNGGNKYITDSNGTIKVPTKELLPDTYSVKITFAGNKNYTGTNTTASVIVNKINTELNASDITATYNINKDLTVSLKDVDGNPISDAKVSVDLNGAKDYTTDSNGQIKVPTKDLGANTYTAKITYAGDEIYNGSTAEATVTIKKDIPEITAENLNTSYQKEDYLTASLQDSQGNPISGAKLTVDLNGAKDYTTDSNGQIKVPTKDLGANTYTAKITYAGSKNYTETNASATLTVEKLNTQINATDLNTSYQKEDYLTATLRDTQGNPISGEKVSVELNGLKEYTTDSNGQIKVPTKELPASNYTATISYAGSGNYIGSDCSARVDVERKTTRFKFSNMTTTAINYIIDGRNGKYFNFYLFDADGNPLEGKNVSIGFNEKVYNKTTDANGRARLQINLAKVFKYTFALAFLGDENYNGTFDTASITVMSQTPKLSTSSKTYKSTAKTKSLSATFKTSRGNPVANRKIKFTVNGKTYTGKTNSKGIATVKVSLNKKGTYKFTVKFAGDNTYKAVSKSAKLTIK